MKQYGRICKRDIRNTTFFQILSMFSITCAKRSAFQIHASKLEHQTVHQNTVRAKGAYSAAWQCNFYNLLHYIIICYIIYGIK